MRIRKNAKLSPLLFSSSCSSLGGGSFPVQTHMCQLNQSPWDVIPFDSDSIQFEGEHSFTAGDGGVGGGVGGGSAGDSIGAVESVASMMPRIEDMVMEDDNHPNHKQIMTQEKMENARSCEGFDAKGWPCRNEPKRGHSFCRHHLSLFRSETNKKAAATITTAATHSASGARRGAARGRAGAGKKPSSNSFSSNPYEFYYYSGFGPSWGKRRGGDKSGGGEGSKNNSNGGGGGGGGEGENENSTMAMECDNVVATTTTPTPSSDNNNTQSVVVIDDNNEEFDYVDDDDNDEDDANEDDDDCGKKRMRKPIKARSLKSLM